MNHNIEENEKQWNKKEVRRNANKLARGVILYELIMILIVIVDLIRRAVLFSSEHQVDIGSVPDQFFNEVIESGTSSIVSVLLGVLFLLYYFRKCDYRKFVFHSEEKMSGMSFLILLTIFMSAQVVFSIFGQGVEAGLNQFGYSILSEIDSATSSSSTASMLLYASFLGPITEEIVFRGFIMRGLQKYGSYYAIIMSAVIFGAFHGNFVQSIFAALVGLVLGYTAMRYSLKWSILLHVINNFIFGDILSYLTADLNESMQSAVFYGIQGIFLAGAIAIMIRKRNEIKKFLKNRIVEKGLMKLTLTSVWMLLYLAFQILIGISGIEKLPV